MPDQLDKLTTALSDRYRIERELGAGGMATVYLAEDLKHKRKVAVKVLRPELAAAVGHDRFLREITTTANLRHPHILPLYDSGDADGFLFYVMPYVEGESLQTRLAREKQLPLEDALQIAREVADALSYAHAHDVVHRDIKPDNIMLESGHAVVADFGIARAVDAAGGEALTQTGIAVGTPVYMSPEQAAGQADVDGRSDLYSLGCVLYEMLGGQPPFTGATVESLVHQHVMVDPAPITNLRPAVPPPVVAALARALAKTPADRFNPVGMFASALAPEVVTATHAATPLPASAAPPSRAPWIIGGTIVVAAVLAAGFLLLGNGGGGTPASPDDRSVAVLPFENIGGDPDSDYFSAGITEDILAHLSKHGDFKVVRATQYAGDATSMRDVGQALGVNTVLSGSVRQAGDDVRVVAQLIDTETDQALWAETYDRKLESIFAIQTEIASQISEAMGTVLVTDVAAASGPTTDLEAYRLFLRARFLRSQRSAESMPQAVSYFEQAIARDSTFAEAWAALAETWVLMPVYADATAEEALPRVLEAADRAVALDRGLAAAHTARGLARVMMAFDFDGGIAEVRRAVALDPGYPKAHHWLGVALAFRGDLAAALPALERAAELEPLSLIIHNDLARYAFFAGRQEQGIAEFEKTLELDPRFAVAYIRSAEIYRLMGRHEEESERLERWNALLELPAFPPGSIKEAFRSGGAQGMHRFLSHRTDTRTSEEAYHRAGWLVALGEMDEAVAVLEEEVATRGQAAMMLVVSTSFSPLRDDARFQTLVEEVYGR
jgi:serine/threonine-protein kinase